MVFDEEIISKKIVKPSFSTPNTSRFYKISFIDQMAPPVYVPVVFFYRNDESHHINVSESLRQSLSHILTLYYPLAGKLEGNTFIDCDDSGVEFVEARVHARVEHFQTEPKTEELRQLVPVDSSPHIDSTLLLVKLSFLDCGGFSVGVCWSHKVIDFASFTMFMKAWATTCRGELTQITRPYFDLHLHFPPKELAPNYFSGEREKIITKRLVFDKKMLEKIREKEAGCSDHVKNPTRVEALSSFIWKIFIEATKKKRDTKMSSFVALHAINLRPRTVPPIPDSTFGNCYVAATTYVSDDSDVVSNLRASIKEVDDDYIKNVINGDDYLRILDETFQSFKSSDLYNCSSWWRFPVYDVDYGWGKPAWVCTVPLPYRNFVFFMSTPSEDGIEAWTNMPEDFSEIFESNYNKLLTV